MQMNCELVLAHVEVNCIIWNHLPICIFCSPIEKCDGHLNISLMYFC